MTRDRIMGFLWGALLMAILDVADIWVCMGECGDIPARIWTEELR